MYPYVPYVTRMLPVCTRVVFLAVLFSSAIDLLSHGGHFESQENKKLCFCTSSLALDERLDVQNLLFQHCVIKVYSEVREV